MLRLTPLSLSLSAAVSVIAMAGCSIGKIDPNDIDLTSGTAPIRYNSDRSIDTPIATGSQSTITVDLKEGTYIDSASTGDSTIASLGAITTYGSRSSVGFPVNAKRAGSTPFIVLDERGKEIGRATIHVADTKAIRIDCPDGLTLVSGATYTAHATTMGEDDVVLVGDGAIAFEASGTLAGRSSEGVFCLGDCGTFATNGIGDGHLHTVAKGATADRTFHVIDQASIDAIAFNVTEAQATLKRGALLDFKLFAGSAVVVPAANTVSCTSADPSVATVDFVLSGAALTDQWSGEAVVGAHASGTTTVTCTIGSHAATAQVTVP